MSLSGLHLPLFILVGKLESYGIQLTKYGEMLHLKHIPELTGEFSPRSDECVSLCAPAGDQKFQVEVLA